MIPSFPTLIPPSRQWADRLLSRHYGGVPAPKIYVYSFSGGFYTQCRFYVRGHRFTIIEMSHKDQGILEIRPSTYVDPRRLVGLHTCAKTLTCPEQ